MHIRLNKCFKLLLAIIIAFVIANLICFLYERPVGWIDTPNGPCRAVREPGTVLVHGTEGYSVSRIDSYGYTNNDYPLADSYILIMGASHTQGKEIPVESRYSTLVNNEITNGAKELKAFNIACDGNVLPLIINHFQSAVITFPNSSCVVIEIGSTDYSVDQLESAAHQIEQIDSTDAKTLFSERTLKKRINDAVKDYFPLISQIKTQYETAQEESDSSSNTEIDADDYYDELTHCLRLIRSEYDQPIVFVYHPDIAINENGTIEIVYSKTISIFKRVCQEEQIDFIDVSNKFIDQYSATKELPYGFSNTTPGSGHLNEIGHNIIARSIIEYLKEKNIQ